MHDMNNDIAKVLISEEQLQAKVAELGAQISRDYKGKDLLLVSILKGSVVFMADLMRATEILSTTHVQATYRVLVGLLAVTGMRIGEAIGLDCDDLDTGGGIVTIRKGKFGKARALPLHPTTVAVLQNYLLRADRPSSSGAPVLLSSSTGKRLRYSSVHPTFQKLLYHCGIVPRSATCRPRIHDLRHSFAVSTIADGYRSGNPGSRLATLATYLGHVDPKHTYWYLSAAPELLGLAGDMLERHLAGEA